jgi:uncharacterized membrane protein YdbT with pleckstrin-like domain
LLGPFLLAIAAFAVDAGVSAAVASRHNPVPTAVGLLALMVLLWFLWKIVEWSATRVLVTDQRIIQVSGVFSRSVASLPLAKVTDMTYRRSIAGRVLGYGDLILESAGQRQGLSSVERMPDPDHFYRVLTSLVARAEQRPYQPPWSPDDGASEGDGEDTGPIPRVMG